MQQLTFIVPCFNAEDNLPALYESLRKQQDTVWKAIFIDDVSTDGKQNDSFRKLLSEDPRVRCIRNETKKFALRNIVETVRNVVPSGIIAVIDGDDELCNDQTVTLVKAAHSQPGCVVWTAHRWDINGMNISRDLPGKVNPYQTPWVSSHLRTFDANLLKDIPDSNFKDHLGQWFERGYDQALMLPLLYKASCRKYLPDVCYLYKINSCSVNDRDWAEVKQLRTVNMVRARGFLNE